MFRWLFSGLFGDLWYLVSRLLVLFVILAILSHAAGVGPDPVGGSYPNNLFGPGDRTDFEPR